MVNLLELPTELLVFVAELLSPQDLIAFISINEVLISLGDSIKLICRDPMEPVYFTTPKFGQNQKITLKSEIQINADGTRPSKLIRQNNDYHKYPGKLHLIELPDFQFTSKSEYDELLLNEDKHKIIYMNDDAALSESEVSHSFCFTSRTLTGNSDLMLYATLQRNLVERGNALKNSKILLNDFKNFTLVDSQFDTSKFFFPKLKSLLLINPQIINPKKLSLPSLSLLRLEENIEDEEESNLKIMDLSEYPSSEFFYYYSPFIPSGKTLNLIVRDLTFGKLTSLAVLESITDWQNITFPHLRNLIVSTVKKTDHTNYSQLTNLIAPSLQRLEIQYDCAQFPKLQDIHIPLNTVISLKAVCNLAWRHHHDTTLISTRTEFLRPYENIELIDAIDLLGCVPLESVKDLKISCEEYYWHVPIHTVPAVLPSLEYLAIDFHHDTLSQMPLIPGPTLKNLKCSNSWGPSYHLADICDQYPELERLYITVKESSYFNSKMQIHNRNTFENLTDFIIQGGNYALEDLMDSLKKFNFPSLKVLTITGAQSYESCVIENFQNRFPALETLSLTSSKVVNLSLVGFKSLKLLGLSDSTARFTYDPNDLQNLVKIIKLWRSSFSQCQINNEIINPDTERTRSNPSVYIDSVKGGYIPLPGIDKNGWPFYEFNVSDDDEFDSDYST